MIHIPPGVYERSKHAMAFRPEYNARFNGLMRTYGDVILGIYAAHFHFDSFRIFYNNGIGVLY